MCQKEEIVPDIDNEEHNETALSRYSEKLAIAFGLISMKPVTMIQ